MATLITVTETGKRSVKVDVTDAAARQAKVFGRTQQERFAFDIIGALGIEAEPETLMVTSKRGVANRGFTVLLLKTEG